jgi:hypothetical protein
MMQANDLQTNAATADIDSSLMSCKVLRFELQRMGLETCESTPKKDLQQMLKMAIKLSKLSNHSADMAVPAELSVTSPDAFICLVCKCDFSTTEAATTLRSLECGHSFCTSCLKHIRSQLATGAVTTYVINCPVCRHTMPVPTVKDVESLPKNFAAISMIKL